jgi:outer membrane protein assembly factor BamB
MVAGMGCVVLLGMGDVRAQNWPQWRGPNRDDKVTGFAAPQKWPEKLNQKWKVPVGQGDSTPALIDQQLYVFTRQGNKEMLLCLNATDGAEAWRYEYETAAVSGPSSRHPGPRSSPAAANGKVVTLGAAGILSCVDTATHKQVWQKDPFPGTVPQYFTGMSPIIVDGLVVAHLGGRGNGTIFAYDLATGDEKWKCPGDGPAYASPVLVTVDGIKQVVTLTEKSVVGVAMADGKLLWQLPFAVQGMSYNAATPIVDGQTVIYTGQGRGAKAVKIEKKADGWAATEIWNYADLAPQFNTPVLKDGLLFGLSERGALYCVDTKSNKTAWTDSTNRGNFGSILDAGSCLMVLPQNGELTVYKADGKEYSEIAKYKVAETQTYAHPVISGNRIFVKDQESLTLWTLD